MGQLLEIGSQILSSAETRLEITGQNVSNITTHAYKARIPFSVLLNEPTGPRVEQAIDVREGQVQTTDNPLDLAIRGSGFFVVRSGNEYFLTRDGRFQLDGDRRLVTASGHVVQSEAGDIVLGTQSPAISADGWIADGDAVVAKVLVVNPDVGSLEYAGPGLFRGGRSAPVLETPSILQGMLETSNVSLATEMMRMSADLRLAQSGQRVIQTYDTLMGRVLSAFG